MTPLAWILLATLAMSLLAWVGLVFLALRDDLLRWIIPSLVAFAAGSLIGGAFLHLIPEALRESDSVLGIFLWLLAGFTLFLFLEQFLNWHHSHRPEGEAGTGEVKPVTHLILIADGVHNFVGGLAIGASFLVSPRVGLITWLAAAAHEIPQEFGDFGILVQGGWSKRGALTANFLSALTIVPGGLIAYGLDGRVDAVFLLPFAAGNFTYIAASDLIPEIKHGTDVGENLVNALMFVGGILLIFATRMVA